MISLGEVFIWTFVVLQIGRIPNEWARCLVPLVKDNKIKVQGFCKYAPENLSIMDTIALNVR